MMVRLVQRKVPWLLKTSHPRPSSALHFGGRELRPSCPSLPLIHGNSLILLHPVPACRLGLESAPGGVPGPRTHQTSDSGSKHWPTIVVLETMCARHGAVLGELEVASTQPPKSLIISLAVQRPPIAHTVRGTVYTVHTGPADTL